MGDIVVTVGIIDDDEDMILILTAMLDGGYTVVAYEEVKPAIEAFEAKPPDVILLDISMPEMDGHAVLAHIRQSETLKNVPVVALTGFSRTQDREGFLKAGFNEYLSKPVTDPEQLIRCIKEAMNG